MSEFDGRAEKETQFMKKNMEIVFIILVSGLLLSGCTMELNTVTPTVTSTPEEEVTSCRELRAVSDPVVVRDANVGDAEPDFIAGQINLSVGRDAFYPKAISTDAGILVTWQMSFDGQSPKPNVFMRLLNDHAARTGDVRNLFERNMTGLSYNLLKVENETVLAFCGRYGTKDQATTVFLNPQGEVHSEQQLPPTDHSCGASKPSTVWTGSSLMTAWTDNGTEQVFLNVADRNGNSLFWKELLSEGDYGPQVVMGHGRVLITVNSKPSEHSPLMIYRFDLDGNELGDPIVINPLTFEKDGIVRENSFTTPYLIPTTDGWMLLSTPRSWSSALNGIYVAHLAPDGTLIFGPFLTGLDLNLRFSNGIEQVFPYRQGAILWGTSPLVFVSRNGVVNSILKSSQEPGTLYTFFFEHREKLFSVYTKEVDSMTNQVLLREVECTP
jgi:hypothetical protein